jgi:hypothetical protein
MSHKTAGYMEYCFRNIYGMFCRNTLPQIVSDKLTVAFSSYSRRILLWSSSQSCYAHLECSEWKSRFQCSTILSMYFLLTASNKVYSLHCVAGNKLG